MSEHSASPADQPCSAGSPRPVVVYDGDCRFCRRQIRRLRRRDDAGRFECVPRQTQGLDGRFPQLAGTDLDAGLRLVHPDGSVSVGADAVYQVARQLAGWRRLAWLYRVAGLHGALRTAYTLVARHRRRLAPGDGD